MSSSDLSELTSNVSSSDEGEHQSVKKGTIDHYFKDAAKAPPPKLKKKRPPSPPHEYVLADREEIAFLVMFRSRFSEILPKSLSHLGPQDIENSLQGIHSGEQVERLLCALLGLVLNRKKEVEKGHFSRALEDAISSNVAQWPLQWEGKNPLHGGRTFASMTPEEKLVLLKALVFWAFDNSEAVKTMLKDNYKNSRHDDDLNQPLSVQPWGRDGDKRRFWLIEGQDDTNFRLYRESNPSLKTVTWRSLAGSIEELRKIADDLGEEGTVASRRLRDRIMASIPRFEAGEDKRRRREYRMARKAQFARPEPGFSLYEGRTRGKRIRYTYSDDEEATSDTSARPSNRQSGINTPAEPAGPRYTASGRQIRSRHGGDYGESLLTGAHTPEQSDQNISMNIDAGEENGQTSEGHSRPTAGTEAPKRGRGRPRLVESVSPAQSDDSDNESISSKEWNGGDEDEDAADQDDEDDGQSDLDMSEEGLDAEEQLDLNQSLVVRLRYGKGSSKSPQTNGIKPSPQPTDLSATTPALTESQSKTDKEDQDMIDAPPMPPVQSPSVSNTGPSKSYSQPKQLPSPPHVVIFQSAENAQETAAPHLSPAQPLTAAESPHVFLQQEKATPSPHQSGPHLSPSSENVVPRHHLTSPSQ